MADNKVVIQPQQILLPKKVYIGDTAELRCNFNSSEPVFATLTANGIADISLDSFVTPLDSRDFEILQVKLLPAGINYYQLSINFKAWKTGNIKFPPMKIEEIQIDFNPVNIVSISEQEQALTLRDSVAPLLLPGTSYKLYGTLIVFVILLIAAIRLFIKRKSVLLFINNRRLLRKYKKNKKQTLKKLNLFKDSDTSDKQIAQQLQQLMRNYLEIRFSYSFTKTVTSQIMSDFYKATNNVFNEKKEEAVGDIAAVFIRLDYLRYSGNSTFNAGEKIELIDRLIKAIEMIEEGGNDKNA